jgi:hypothetical protein
MEIAEVRLFCGVFVLEISGKSSAEWLIYIPRMRDCAVERDQRLEIGT